jgi:hypothetical protein
MKRALYLHLRKLERLEAEEPETPLAQSQSSPIETFQTLLSRHGFQPRPEESLAETVARASGLDAQQLKRILWERSQSAGE